jgi:hypothetical protein
LGSSPRPSRRCWRRPRLRVERCAGRSTTALSGRSISLELDREELLALLSYMTIGLNYAVLAALEPRCQTLKGRLWPRAGIVEFLTKRSSVPDRRRADGRLTSTRRAAPRRLSGRGCRSPR